MRELAARILIVDDNETNREILGTRLETHGYELLQAARWRGGAGERRAASARPDPARRR